MTRLMKRPVTRRAAMVMALWCVAAGGAVAEDAPEPLVHCAQELAVDAESLRRFLEGQLPGGGDLSQTCDEMARAGLGRFAGQGPGQGGAGHEAA